jgi:hypothetical protein
MWPDVERTASFEVCGIEELGAMPESFADIESVDTAWQRLQTNEAIPAVDCNYAVGNSSEVGLLAAK